MEQEFTNTADTPIGQGPNSRGIELNLEGQKDRLFEGRRYPVPFAFNAEVAEVFDDMVARSVPLYKEVNLSLLHWFNSYYQKNTVAYDIGCSTGTAFRLIAENFQGSKNAPIRFCGLDTSAPMLEKAQQKTEHLGSGYDFKWICGDAEGFKFEPTSFSIFNYTLQFMPVKKRKAVLRKISDATVPGGVSLISEKVRCEDPALQESVTYMYEDFKVRQGYSKSEIARKKEALERVLVPLSENEMKKLLFEAGFSHVETVLKQHNFVTFIALKN